MTLKQLYEAEKHSVMRGLLTAAIISILGSLCLLTVPLYLSQTYQRVIPSRSVETMVALTVLAVVLMVTYSVLDSIRSNFLTRLGIRFEAKVSGLLLAGELSLPRGSSQQSLHQLGEIRKLLTSSVLPSLFDIPVMVIFTGIVFAINGVLGIIVLVGMGVLFLTALLTEILTSRLVKESEESGAAARKSLTSHFAQQELVRALGLYPQVVNRWGKLQGTHLAQLVSLLGRTAMLSATSKLTRQLIQIAIIGGGALLVIEDDLNAGIIFATSVIASRALAPIEQVVGGWRSLKQGRLALQKLNERIGAFKLIDNVTPLPRPSRSLQADRVVYAPTLGAQPILKGITGGFRPGEAVAVVGPSGAGKSTFARMLVGYLEPSGGQVSLDGQDLRAWDPVTRGSYMGYMPQNVSLFEGTIRENIARMRSEDPPELAIEAARFVGIHELIMRFPNGYDSLISDGGFQPSGGQRQLLGLARAFYGGPAFVVLDEPNASLDGEGENILFNTIKQAKAAKIGTIIVTQRLSLLHHVDQVLSLKNGLVDAYGPPSEVLPGKVRAVPNQATS